MSDLHLHLHVKTEYFEAIKRGEKTEEYRLYNDYWQHRIGFVCDHRLCKEVRGEKVDVRNYSNIIIHNAYKSGDENRLTFPWRGWTLKTITHPHFGPEPVTVFAIKLENGK